MSDMHVRHAEGDRHLAAQAALVRRLIDSHGSAPGCVCTESGYRCVAAQLFESLRRLPAESLADLLTGAILTRAMSGDGVS